MIVVHLSMLINLVSPKSSPPRIVNGFFIPSVVFIVRHPVAIIDAVANLFVLQRYE